MTSTGILPLSRCPHLAAEIARLLHQEWHDFSRWADAEQIADRLLQRNRPGSGEFTLLSLTEDGSLSGTASVIRNELPDDPARPFWLGEVFTAPRWRGQGTGRQLVLACVAQARQQGIPALWLYTPDQQSWYQRLGWVEAEQREVAGEQVSVMVQVLG